MKRSCEAVGIRQGGGHRSGFRFCRNQARFVKPLHHGVVVGALPEDLAARGTAGKLPVALEDANRDGGFQLLEERALTG
jgi:hypothetical protein